MKTDKKLIGTGLLTAIAASLCCITPVLALIAGTSGLASTFSWLEPFRPYFIGLTILVLGFAWYQKLKPLRKIDCNCEVTEKPNFMQTSSFLGIVTVFAGLLLSFPIYSHIFFSQTKSKTIITQTSKIQKVEFAIKGMTCSGCEQHIKTEINRLKGIVEVVVSYEKGNAIVKFDSKQTSITEIENAINSTGYKAINSKTIS
ncbi:mercuric transport protein MerTP [Chryseobacterium indologenes]|uniref:Mercuric transport protein MerT n=3 Tax=Chryseobacterium TaxID=59732 RepID=A0A3G6RJ19_CHRLC|nr:MULTISPECIES: mercuric transport protein MerTP [Bacteroidota]ASE62083.1 heavy metal transporter [Chryseobacterium indologenes]AZA84574.1 mercuric transport protein MerTP [Chryseobacterium lactis]AZB04962.1 mercuric transport protein MerTP [Chryseobacterium lactis]KMQ64437.1 heavy metal transporter [Chryseobacterium angstadtii]MBF6643618.1 mercuric transport protein MerTP [Chryseobacterium indologenes]